MKKNFAGEYSNTIIRIFARLLKVRRKQWMQSLHR